MGSMWLELWWGKGLWGVAGWEGERLTGPLPAVDADRPKPPPGHGPPNVLKRQKTTFSSTIEERAGCLWTININRTQPHGARKKVFENLLTSGSRRGIISDRGQALRTLRPFIFRRLSCYTF